MLKHGFQSQVTQAQWLCHLTVHVALGELWNLCQLQVPPLQHEDNSTFLIELLGGLNEKT